MGCHEKLIYKSKLPKKGGAWTVFRFKGGSLAKKVGGLFLRRLEGDTPMHTMNLEITLTVILIC